MDARDKEQIGSILTLKEQERIKDAWLNQRLMTVLPESMANSGIDMWVIASKEYNEDPVMKTLYPSAIDSSGRLTILAFFYNKLKGRVERYAICPPHPPLGTYYQFCWNRKEETQWACLKRIIEEKNPSVIGINRSSHFAVSDGLTSSLYNQLREEIGEDYAERLSSAEILVMDWLFTRSSDEMIAYPHIANMTRMLTRRVLSNEVIHPGVTTTDEVVAWIRQKVADYGLRTSFYPTIDLQRKDAPVDRLSGVTIMPGDVVHLDFGIEYLGLSTDTQQLGYVLRNRENDAPEGLKNALNTALRMEDIVLGHFRSGRTGNEVFRASIQQAKAEGLQAMLYSHPVGRHCHEAGPLVGLYDQQGDIPYRGDLILKDSTAYAMEFNIKQHIPEWGHEIFIYLEQPIAILNGSADYLTSRQEAFYIIR
jgi:hypothetical protein